MCNKVKLEKFQIEHVNGLFKELQDTVSRMYCNSNDEDFREIFHELKDIKEKMNNKMEPIV